MIRARELVVLSRRHLGVPAGRVFTAAEDYYSDGPYEDMPIPHDPTRPQSSWHLEMAEKNLRNFGWVEFWMPHDATFFGEALSTLFINQHLVPTRLPGCRIL